MLVAELLATELLMTDELLLITELLTSDELLTELELGGTRLDETLEDEGDVATELDETTEDEELVAALELTPQPATTPKGEGWLAQVAVVIQLLPFS